LAEGIRTGVVIESVRCPMEDSVEEMKRERDSGRGRGMETKSPGGISSGVL